MLMLRLCINIKKHARLSSSVSSQYAVIDVTFYSNVVVSSKTVESRCLSKSQIKIIFFKKSELSFVSRGLNLLNFIMLEHFGYSARFSV